MSVIFSAAKGAVAVLAWLLAQRGVLAFSAPVTAYWPEFVHGGKSAIPVQAWLNTPPNAPAAMPLTAALILPKRMSASIK